MKVTILKGEGASSGLRIIRLYGASLIYDDSHAFPEYGAQVIGFCKESLVRAVRFRGNITTYERSAINSCVYVLPLCEDKVRKLAIRAYLTHYKYRNDDSEMYFKVGIKTVNTNRALDKMIEEFVLNKVAARHLKTLTG